MVDGPLARTTATADDGSFQMPNLLPGRYRLTVSRPGYVTVEYGQRQPPEPGQVFTLAPNEVRERFDVTLPHTGAITGRVVDENGDAVQGAQLHLFEMRFIAGRQQLADVAGVSALATNDIGRFRIYGVQPGRYVVGADMGAALGPDDPTGYATTYFPGTPDAAEAQFVRVGVSEEVANLEFALVPARTARVTGITLNAEGEPHQGGIQMRQTRRSSPVASDSFGARTWPDGRFEFPSVPAGEYAIDAQNNNLHAVQIVNVAGTDVTGLVLQTRPGSTITGRVVFDGADAPSPRGVAITAAAVSPDLVPFNGGVGTSSMNGDGTFELTNVYGPQRLRLIQAPPGWMLKQILVNGIDETDAVFTFGTREQSVKNVEVVLTNRLTGITGSVVDGGRQPVRQAVVLAFPVERDRWYFGSRFFAVSRSTSEGRFGVFALPPGEYHVAAVDRIEGGDGDGAWQDPEYLERLSREATMVTLSEGQRAMMTLTVNPR